MLTMSTDRNTITLPNHLPQQKGRFRNDSEAKLLKTDVRLFVATSRSPSCDSVLYRSTLVFDWSDIISMASTYDDKYFRTIFLCLSELFFLQVFPLFGPSFVIFQNPLGFSKFPNHDGGVTSFIYRKWFQLLMWSDTR